MRKYMAKTEKKAPKEGIGTLARELILSGKSNIEVLEVVKKKYPESAANAGTIGWYRNDLKKAGRKVKDSRAITAAAKKTAAKTKKAGPTNVELTGDPDPTS